MQNEECKLDIFWIRHHLDSTGESLVSKENVLLLSVEFISNIRLHFTSSYFSARHNYLKCLYFNLIFISIPHATVVKGKIFKTFHKPQKEKNTIY